MNSSQIPWRDLECPICLEPFHTEGAKAPALLLCGHSITFDCLPKLVKESILVCPICRAETQLNGPSYGNINKNYTLIDLIQLAQTQESEESPKICENCEKNDAELYCENCEAVLCTECDSDVHSNRITQKHIRRDLSTQAPNKPETCKFHPSYPVDLVCLQESCDEELMCMFCSKYGKHKGHHHNAIESIASETRKRIENKVGAALALCKELKIASATAESVMNEITVDAAIHSVRSSFSAVRDALLLAENVAVAAVGEEAARKRRVLEAQQQHMGEVRAVVGGRVVYSACAVRIACVGVLLNCVSLNCVSLNCC